MEHFSFEQQFLLDEYLEGTLSLEDVVTKYKEIGTENHDIMKYRDVLEHAKENKDKISLIAGFIPRTYAKQVMREGEEAAVKASLEKNYIAEGTTEFTAPDFHYNMFESMISGRNMFDKNLQPKDNFKKLFKAQLIKDYAMAHKVNTYIDQHHAENDKYMIVSGKGHMQFFQGIPKMVFEKHPDLEVQSSMVVAHETDKNIDIAQSDDTILENVVDIYGEEGANPGDFLYLFDKPEECMTEEEKVKKATFTAYNEVGSTAHKDGNMEKAKAIMKYLGYSDSEYEIAGKDSMNYQGVGNPHQFAKI